MYFLKLFELLFLRITCQCPLSIFQLCFYQFILPSLWAPTMCQALIWTLWKPRWEEQTGSPGSQNLTIQWEESGDKHIEPDVSIMKIKPGIESVTGGHGGAHRFGGGRQRTHPCWICASCFLFLIHSLFWNCQSMQHLWFSVQFGIYNYHKNVSLILNLRHYIYITILSS